MNFRLAIFTFFLLQLFGLTVKSQCSGNVNLSQSANLCQNQNGNFNFQYSGGSYDSIKVFWADGSIQSINPPVTLSKSFSNVGLQQNYYIVYDTTCTDTQNFDVTIFQATNSDFTISEDSVCSNELITFTNTSTNSQSIAWNFGSSALGSQNNGSSNTEQRSYAPSTYPGSTYQVRLISTSVNGCLDTTTKPVFIRSAPSVSVNDTVDTVVNRTPFINCAGNNPNFELILSNHTSPKSAVSQYIIDWDDDVIDTLTSNQFSNFTQHTFGATGYFSIEVTAIDNLGCSSSETHTFFNGSNPAVGITGPGNTTELCTGDTVVFPVSYRDAGGTLNPPGTEYKFFLNDGGDTIRYTHPKPPFTIDSLINYSFASSSCGITSLFIQNSFLATIIAENPCGATPSATSNIKVSQIPTANFSMDSTIVCENIDVGFYNESEEGFNLINNTCQDAQKNWVIKPSNGWVVSSGALGSSNPTTNPATWGSNTLFLNFSNPGTYTVKLRASNKCGKDSIEKTICVQPEPVASFSTSINTICENDTITFTNSSNTLAACGDTKYTWDASLFETICDNSIDTNYVDNTSPNTTNAKLSFLNSGKHQVKLTVENSCATPGEAFDTVIVNGIPEINSLDSIIDSLCGNTTVINPILNFDSCNSPITSFSWYYSSLNEDTSYSRNPTFNVLDTGNYTVTVQIENQCGISNIVSKTSYIGPNPFLDAGVDRYLCSGDSTILGGVANINPILKYNWTPTNGLSNPNKSNPELKLFNTSDNNDTLKYVLNYEDSITGCASVDSLEVIVVKEVDLSFLRDTFLCSGEPKNFGFNSPIANHIISWSPANGIDNTTSFLPTFQISNNTPIPIDYNYKVTVTDTFSGCSWSHEFIVTVRPKVNVNAGLDKYFCSNLGSQIGVAVPEIGFTFLWSPTLNLTNPSAPVTQINATNSTTDTLSLEYVLTKTEDLSGCYSTDTVSAFVLPLPRINLNDIVEICSGDTFTLGNAPRENTTYTWNPTFSLHRIDSSIVTGRIFVNSFEAYKYFITATDTLTSCTYVDSVVVNVNPLPNNDIGIDTSVCSNTPVVIGRSGIASNIYQWSPSSSLSATNIANPTFTRINNGDTAISLTYLLTIIDSNQCENYDTVYINLNPLPKSGFKKLDTACAGDTFNIGGATNQNFLYSWSTTATLSDSTISNPLLFSQIITNAINRSANLSLTDTTTGCVNLENFNFYIKAAPPAGLAGPNQSVCSGDTIQLGQSSISNLTYLWSPAGGLLSTNLPQPKYVRANSGNQPIDENYKLFVTDSISGCSREDSVKITNYKEITLQPINNYTLCSFDTLKPVFQSLDSNVQFNWTVLNTPAGSISGLSNGSLEPNFIPKVPINNTISTATARIIVTAQLNNCISNPDTFFVTVNPSAEAIYTNPSPICSGNNMQVSLSSLTNNVTFSWDTAWVFNSQHIVNAKPDSGNIINQNPINNNDSVVASIRYIITPNYLGCVGKKDSLIININPTPSLSIDSVLEEICSKDFVYAHGHKQNP